MTKNQGTIATWVDRPVELESRIEAFRESRFFYTLSDIEIAILAAKSYPRSYKKGDFIIREQDIQQEYMLVQKGLIKIFTQSAAGRNFTVSLLSKGDSVMAVGIFSQEPVWCSAQALTDVTLLIVNRNEYISFVNDHIEILHNYINFCQAMLKQAHARLGELAVEKIDKRIINVLKILINKFGNTINLTSADIAELAGTTTETTIRFICRLKKEEIVSTGRGKLTIINAAKLNNFFSGTGIDTASLPETLTVNDETL